MKHSLLSPRLTSVGRARRGYVLLVAIILMAIIAVIGATSLRTAGVDQRIAVHNRKHMMVFNTSTAGVDHGRALLETEDPPGENLDSAGDSWGAFVTWTEGDTLFGGTTFDQNLGVYQVEAVYEKCSNPPPGYSTELGRQAFRSDYWTVESTARMSEVGDTTYASMNETQSTVVATIRKVVHGPCKIR